MGWRSLLVHTNEELPTRCHTGRPDRAGCLSSDHLLPVTRSNLARSGRWGKDTSATPTGKLAAQGRRERLLARVYLSARWSEHDGVHAEMKTEQAHGGLHARSVHRHDKQRRTGEKQAISRQGQGELAEPEPPSAPQVDSLTVTRPRAISRGYKIISDADAVLNQAIFRIAIRSRPVTRMRQEEASREIIREKRTALSPAIWSRDHSCRGSQPIQRVVRRSEAILLPGPPDLEPMLPGQLHQGRDARGCRRPERA